MYMKVVQDNIIIRKERLTAMADNSNESRKQEEDQQEEPMHICAGSSDAGNMDIPRTSANRGRRMTLTVTDLSLSPALFPVAEPTNLAETQTIPIDTDHNVRDEQSIPSELILEEKVVRLPEHKKIPVVDPRDYYRRGSLQIPAVDPKMRFVRTPSVVVSDYSDETTAAGISRDELEYLRRMRNLASVDIEDTMDSSSDSNSPSSSNLSLNTATFRKRNSIDGADYFANALRRNSDSSKMDT